MARQRLFGPEHYGSRRNIEGVQEDGGSFNVREGNHALNLASTPWLALTTGSVRHADR